MRLKKKICGIVLCLALAFGLMPGMSMTAYAESEPTVTISPEGGGTVSIETSGSGIAAKYTFTATPVEDYRFVKWTFKDYDGSTASVTNNPWDCQVAAFTGGSYSNLTAVFESTTTPVSGISLDQSAVSLSVGGTVSFTATVEPNDATDKYVTWSSNSDALKLYADSSCTVALGTTTGVAAGQPIYAKGISLGGATVTATSRSNNDVTASCDVTVISNTYNVTYKVVNGTWSDGSTADKTETVASGGNPTSVPAGMKADLGYTGGSWDTAPSTATISADTTFTYTFVADSSSGGDSSDSGNSGSSDSGSTSGGSSDSGNSSSGSTDSGSSSGSSSSSSTSTSTPVPATVPYDKVVISTGAVNDITGTAAATAESNPFGTKIENNDNLTTLLSLTPEEVAQGVNVWLDIQDMSATVSQAEKDIVQNASANYTVGIYLDINLFKKVGGNAATKITETNGTVKASILIPESLWKAGRTFEIIRVHDGVPTVISGTYDENTHVFTFETDKFSTYALAYNDTATSASTTNSTQSSAPRTGDTNHLGVWYLLLAVSLGGLGYLGYTKKKSVNK